MAAPVILVAGGLPRLRSLVRATLEGAGCTVCDAESGRSTLELAVAIPPALVLLDLSLPDMDGYELLDRLRALPGGNTLSIVAIVGTLADTARMMQADFTDYLVKPLDPSRLLEAIRAHLPLA